MSVKVQFVDKSNGPERLVCDAELLFEDGPLAGMKLTGFSVWRGSEGDVYVTFPSRAFGTATDRKFFDYLRVADGFPSSTAVGVKTWIIDEFKAQRGEAA